MRLPVLGTVPLGALAFVASTLALAGCNQLATQYCDLGAECDEGVSGVIYDPVLGNSDDSAAVCAANQAAFLNALRANSEEVCHEAATAYEAWMACALEEGCDSFRIDEPECKDEREKYAELIDDADNRCNE